MAKGALLSFAAAIVLGALFWAVGKGQMGYGFAFSVDIGSDRELSDPNPDGQEGFDPGDAYRTDAPAGSIAGASSATMAQSCRSAWSAILGASKQRSA